MRFRSTILAAGLGVLLAGGPAAATPYSFTITGFTGGAYATIGFDGSDLNGDGAITGAYPSTLGTGFGNEVTSLSVAFSGNAVVPAFSGSTTDFTDSAQSLFISPTGSDLFVMIYVLDSTLYPTSGAILPPGGANGDGLIEVQGSTTDGLVAVYGSQCGAFSGFSFFGPGLCAVAGTGARDGGLSLLDYATVPEPMSLALLGSGLGLMTVLRRRRG
ncbi:MAG: hypothetical protein ABS99_04780 [Acetobacteraceae bacterium SCN 69-10]|nr:PEP-CTERM sorting domain-containing protein [Rhodospirillales bacterium]ODU57650.1 MAG: hypothetical protein ABS99_04780 [Acetobacteraceae bacterium SCN 69-10]OJY64873.1 MAG: hypothetical protein BGP12_03815 [Rhodospirillales bacterium 70-18]